MIIFRRCAEIVFLAMFSFVFLFFVYLMIKGAPIWL